MWKTQLLPAIIFMAVAANISAQNCLPEGITFSTQGQLDSFPMLHPGCTQILGDVRIQEAVPVAISNLNGLLPITHISGSLMIWKNTALTSLKGLDNLTSIDQHLSVNLNKSLISLAGLEKLDTVHGNLGLIRNDKLSSLNGLNHLVVVSANMEISTNPLLTNCNGLDNLTYIVGYLTVTDNFSMESLNGLESMTSIGGNLKVTDNVSLTSISGLESLASIGGDLIVKDNASLTSLHGLDQVSSVGGNMDIYNNPSLSGQFEPKNIKSVGKTIKKQKADTHVTWVTTMGNTPNYTGFLSAVEDDWIAISNYPNQSEAGYNAQNINVENIKNIKFRKQGSVLKGVLLGGLSGILLGGIIGFAQGDDHKDPITGPFGVFTYTPVSYTAGQKAFFGAVALSLPGALIGGIASASKITIPINGNLDTYKRQKLKLLGYKL